MVSYYQYVHAVRTEGVPPPDAVDGVDSAGVTTGDTKQSLLHSCRQHHHRPLLASTPIALSSPLPLLLDCASLAESSPYLPQSRRGPARIRL